MLTYSFFQAVKANEEDTRLLKERILRILLVVVTSAKDVSKSRHTEGDLSPDLQYKIDGLKE